VRLPRWTVYPAIALVGLLVFAAVPRHRAGDRAGAAAAARGELGAFAEPYPRVVVLGIDGLDPELLRAAVERHPQRTPNFRWLIEASGIHELGTSTPPQSPVAWSNFITGQDPGGHGIFDFLHRDPTTRAPIVSTSTTEASSEIPLPGPWVVPFGGGTEPNRSGASFWSLLADAGIPADIWRIPANFPVEPSSGASFSGMMTPAVDSAYGECTLYTTSPLRKLELAHYRKAVQVDLYGDKAITSLAGPANPFKHATVGGAGGAGHRHAPSSAALEIYVDRGAGAAVVEIDGRSLVLVPGQWSAFVKVSFGMGLAGLGDLNGIVRFYLRSVEPELELYASPVDIDPEAPVAPVSEPEEDSAALAAAIGLYYTQGMAEDVNALKEGVLDDEEFMRQSELVHDEGTAILDYAIERYLERAQGGLLFFYCSSVDLCSHMMWRHGDPAHPDHDPAFAARSSEWFSGRPGSTWSEVIEDLILSTDPILGTLRERLGESATYVVMSDHGFAPYHRKFNLNTWLVENGYLVLQPGVEKELPRGDPAFRERNVSDPEVVDWTRTRAYGIGFQGVYLNLAGRELDDRATARDESGIVAPADAPALLAEIKGRLEAYEDPERPGAHPVLRCDLARDVYHGPRVAEAPDILVGFASGYCNSDQATTGRIQNKIVSDNTGGTFNGSHLMAPEVVPGTLLSNRSVRPGPHRLEDVTVEVLARFGLPPGAGMTGHPVLE
jgi:predicted AlkP superfamily phosphohydrolase/phosphomutase